MTTTAAVVVDFNAVRAARTTDDREPEGVAAPCSTCRLILLAEALEEALTEDPLLVDADLARHALAELNEVLDR